MRRQEEMPVKSRRVGDETETKPFWLACLNPHSAQMAMSDPAAAEALKAADVLIPDGVGAVLASRILGGGIRKRITGSDIFRELSRRLNDRGGQPGRPGRFMGGDDGAQAGKVDPSEQGQTECKVHRRRGRRF